MQSIPIPRYLDNPPQILFWESDELVPIVALAGVGIVTGTLTYCLVAAYVLHKVFMRFKSRHMRGYLWHLGYRIGLVPLNKKFQNGATTYYHV